MKTGSLWKTLLLSLVALLAAAAAAAANGMEKNYLDCALVCESQYDLSTVLTFTFCGNDHKTHTVVRDEAVMLCYRHSCNITMEYAGTCQCPNDCNAGRQQGVCAANKCKCADGFGGPDCSQIKCPNHCSGNGKCIESTAFDYCKCEDGWTSYDCSVPSVQLEQGDVYKAMDDPVPQYYHDTYGDNHPVFNLSVIASIYLKVKQEDLDYLLFPANAFTESYVKADMWFHNGIIFEHLEDVGLRLKGLHTRTVFKKPWNIKFKAFRKHDFYNMTKIGLKGYDPSLVKNLLVNDFLRTMGLSVPRSSFANLFINGKYYGVYWMLEDLNKHFIKTRFANTTGDCYQCSLGAYLEYNGQDAQVYQQAISWSNAAGHVWNYRQVSGTGDWSNFVNLVKVISQIDQDENAIKQVLNTDRFLAAQVVDSCISNWDGYSVNGNNYMLYHNPDTGTFEYISWDFDGTFRFPNYGVYDWSNGRAVLYDSLMGYEQYRSKYNSLYQQFLAKVWTSPLLKQRIEALKNLLYRSVRYDPLQVTKTRIDGVEPGYIFLHQLELIVSYIDQRTAYVTPRFDIDLTSISVVYAMTILLVMLSFVFAFYKNQ